MVQIRKDKVAIIGAGRVGESVAFALVVSGKVSEIVMIDIAQDRATGSVLDINHGIAFHKQIRVFKGEYKDCADAGIIIITAGLARKPGQTRLDLAKSNVSITQDIVHNIMQYANNPIIIVISNPVDVLTYVVQKESNLPPARVIGTGTLLDTSRFRYLLSKKCSVDVKDVNAYILGEHGDSQVPIWSSATIAGISLADYCSQNKIDLFSHKEEFNQAVREAGSTVIALKGATYLAIALNTAHIVDVLIENENSILPVSHVIQDEIFGIQDIAISMPCILNENGISRTLHLSLSPIEEKALKQSARTLKAFIDDATDL